MDNLTHTLIGVGLSRCGISRRVGRGATFVLAVASNLPDLDAFWGLAHDGQVFEFRRMLTHSIVGIPLLALGAAFLFRLVYKNLSWKTLFGLSFLGMAVHVFFDLVNSFGVVVLYPFSRLRFEWAWIFIIDLALWFLLATPALLMFIKPLRGRSERIFRVFMVLVVSYVGFCAAARWRSERILERWAAGQALNPSFSYVFPEALGSHRFRGVVRELDTYSLVLINALNGRAEAVDRFVTEDNHPNVGLIRQTEMARKIEWFFKAPVWWQVPSPPETGDTEAVYWEVSDLRFQSAVIRRGNPFVYRFMVKGGRVEFLGKV